MLEFDFNKIDINDVYTIVFLIRQHNPINYNSLLEFKQTELENTIKSFLEIFEYKNKKNNEVSFKNCYYSSKREYYTGIDGVRTPKSNSEKRQFTNLINTKIKIEKEIELIITNKEFINNLIK